MSEESRFFNSLLGNDKFVYNSNQKNNFLYPTLQNLSVPHSGRPRLWGPDQGEHYIENSKKCFYKDHPDYSLFNQEKYTFNRQWYRGEDFISGSPAEVVVAGCSQTWGTGLPDSLIWPNLLKEKLNAKSLNNLGQPGKSLRGVVEIIFAYFKEVGHPKNLFILLPPLHRFRTARTPNFMHSNQVHSHNDILVDANVYRNNNSKFFKIPLNLQEVLTEEIAYDQSLSYLRILEQYCKNFDINLKYTVWYPDDKDLFDDISNKNGYYENYVSIDCAWFNERFFEGEHPSCHEDMANDVRYRMFWKIANDYLFHENAHIGAHASIHIAEKFYEEVFNGSTRN